MRRPTTVSLFVHVADANGAETEWTVSVRLVWSVAATRTDPAEGGEVEFLDATRDGLTLHWNDFVEMYGIDDKRVDALEAEAWEQAADIYACSFEERAESRGAR